MAGYVKSYLELAKEAERKLRASRIEHSHPAEPESEPKPPTPEALAAKVLAEFEPDEAERVCQAWRDIMGVNLDVTRVREHLQALKRWQSGWLAKRRR